MIGNLVNSVEIQFYRFAIDEQEAVRQTGSTPTIR